MKKLSVSFSIIVLGICILLSSVAIGLAMIYVNDNSSERYYITTGAVLDKKTGDIYDMANGKWIHTK